MKLYTIAEAAALPIPPWIVPGWVRERTLTMLTAPGGVGKSNTATAIGVCAAAGIPFLEGEAPERPARVLHVAIDAASWDHGHLARRIAAGLGVNPSDLDGEDDSGGYWFCFEPLLLQDGRFEEVINSVAYSSGAVPDLIIIDSLRNIHDKDEDSSSEMMPVMRFFRRWAEKNCGIVLLHHTKKPSGVRAAWDWDTARGSSALHNSVDAHIVLLPPRARRRPLQGRKLVEAVWVKGRGGDDTPSIKYRTTWNQDEMRFVRVKRGRPPGAPKEA